MKNRGIAKAAKVVAALNLTGRVNLEQVIRAYGIKIDIIEFRGSNVQEITIGNRIAVRRGLSDRRRRWVIAHGIGHVLLHGKGNHVWLHMNDRRRDRDQEEIEAEAFAHKLLVGDMRVPINRLGEHSELAIYYGVPTEKVSSHPIGGFA